MSNPSGPRERGPAFHSRNLDGARAPKRSFAKLSKSKVKDTDLHDVTVRISAVVASMVGALLGAPLGFFVMVQYDFGVWAIPACMAGLGLIVGTTQLLVVGSASGSAKSLYNPSGSSTPHTKEYSYPESLAMRGLYEEAVSAFELVIVEEKSTDPKPYFRIARIYRDDMERYEDAARWFKRALDEADMHSGQQALARKELVELYRVKLGTPQKAAPMLARLAEDMVGTPDGEWAAAELRDIKRSMRDQETMRDQQTTREPEN